MENDLVFYEKDALLYRLHEGLKNSDKNVVFVVGAPLTAPYAGAPGVSDVAAVVELIRSRFKSNSHLEKLDAKLAGAANRYQEAFDFLSPRLGQDAANDVIKQAVAAALVSSGTQAWSEAISRLPEDQLQALDNDERAWHLTPAASALGGLIAKYSNRFGKILITSNFDPLVEVSIRRAGGIAWRTSLSVDGSINQSTADGCQVIHIHGYWHGSDTLHTNRQLVRSRPTLQNDLLVRLRDHIVVVMAYGGWRDIFTSALGGVVGNDNLFPEVLWCLYDEEPQVSEHLLSQLRPGIHRNRVTFYKGIDCHTFLPELLGLWDEDPSRIVDKPATTTAAAATEPSAASKPQSRSQLFRLAPLECDRPPNIGIWVGRENELRAFETSNAKVVIICGIGGEGKSALASHYITTLSEREGNYRFWDWRDCKEQSDRIRTQFVEVIVRFSDGKIASNELTEASDEDLVEVLIDQTRDAHAVLVFDNVDSYVDLENRVFTGAIDLLVQRFAASQSTSRVILTCRPDVQYTPSSVITFSMKGISADEAIDLFAKRAPGHSIPETDIRDAHTLTKGHAFWLDLLAVQVSKVPGTTLRKLLDDMRRGREEVPDVLSSIWDKLALREQTLLRFMAEAVRPETEITIHRFVASKVNYKNFMRALRSLISLNLIVVKPELDAPDLYDLHPLVRQFVRTRFERAERADFIIVVIGQYKAIIRAIGSVLGVNLPFALLERWSQKAELEVSAGMYDDAFETLVEIKDALIGGGHVQEYVRVGRLLFESIDWETAATKYKQFDNVVGTMVSAFDGLGDRESADSLLMRYEATIPHKTARYIKFCDVKSYSYWQRGEFHPAIDWARRGVSLKKDSHVDSNYDCQHTLALAERDAGHPTEALEYFRKDWTVEQIVAEAEGVPEDGPMYGNVGRCLQFMGRNDEALCCYKKSMKLLESDASFHSKSNRAYGRRWVGEVLVGMGDIAKAEAFFMDAIRILGSSAPLRVREIYNELEKLRDNASPFMSEARSSRIVRDWMAA
ncbi:NB-ARC domain-containing protein [Phyllobacterium leguminum]|uniref:NB-ARC domain-containing protein n=1 Tax=Phyllobacterium leguminum TaxID=314237 RepID=A0A318T4B2_9HYPH|nr:NB-ARC domain-containing protein [Phyllobacterium leguminum]PYE85124.1 NB-ARC domain-containing protein [Phyllobacterium leguminum]